MKEKDIKIIPEAIERLRGIYPDMNDEQLVEIFLGESEGVNFASYADTSLTADEMRRTRLALVDTRKKAVCSFECRYFYGTMKYFDMFMPTREILFDSLINEKKGTTYKDIERFAASNGQLQGKMTKIFDTLSRDKLILDIFDDNAARLPEKYASIVSGIRVSEDALATYVSFPITMRADVYKTFGKGAFDTNEGVNITSDTRFVVKNKLASYNEAHFSIALRSPDFSIAIATQANRSATKSEADLAVAIIDEGHIYFDNAKKYIDTSLFVKGLRS